MPDDKAELIIEARPEIHVYENEAGNVVILTVGVHPNGENIERVEIEIPRESLKEVGQALLAIAKRS